MCLQCKQWIVPSAFALKEDGEYRHRNISTLLTLRNSVAYEGKKHRALGKLVYVIPQSRFTKIVGVNPNGMGFYVELMKERGRDLCWEKELEEKETEEENPAEEISGNELRVKAIARQRLEQWQATDLLAT